MTETHSQILLSTLNSTYQHCSFGLRYLKANLHEFSDLCHIQEFTIKQNPRAIVEKLLSYNPKIIGFGIYIWNTEQTLQVLQILKKVAPKVVVILGGPEISYETHKQEHTHWSDFIIQGEGEASFYSLVKKILNNEIDLNQQDKLQTASIINPFLPEVKNLKLPYDLYSDEDIQNRIIYVEASRGCPYRCEYCLSSLDKSVRSFDLDIFLKEMKILIDRGATQFKFVDRTFNLSITTSSRILSFFLENMKTKDLFVHFEMVPDRLPIELRELIEKFPKGSLQFEVGLQTINPVVSATISRKNDLKKVEDNFQYLKAHTGVYTHADLIVGLPGENLQSFAQGFDYLLKLEPNEIQVGILKRLRGTPIIRHDQVYEMIYQPTTPYQVLSTKDLSFQDLQRMNRFAKFWDTIANSNYFPNFLITLKKITKERSFFYEFLKLSDQLSQVYSEAHSIALEPLGRFLFEYTISELKLTKIEAVEIFTKDFSRHNKFSKTLPAFLKLDPADKLDPVLLKETAQFQIPKKVKAVIPKRQQRHLDS